MNKKIFIAAFIVMLMSTATIVVADTHIKGDNWHRGTYYTREQIQQMIDKANQEEEEAKKQAEEKQDSYKKNVNENPTKQKSYWDF